MTGAELGDHVNIERGSRNAMGDTRDGATKVIVNAERIKRIHERSEGIKKGHHAHLPVA